MRRYHVRIVHGVTASVSCARNSRRLDLVLGVGVAAHRFMFVLITAFRSHVEIARSGEDPVAAAAIDTAGGTSVADRLKGVLFFCLQTFLQWAFAAKGISKDEMDATTNTDNTVVTTVFDNSTRRPPVSIGIYRNTLVLSPALPVAVTIYSRLRLLPISSFLV